MIKLGNNFYMKAIDFSYSCSTVRSYGFITFCIIFISNKRIYEDHTFEELYIHQIIASAKMIYGNFELILKK